MTNKDPARLDLNIPRYDKLGDVEHGFTLTGYSLNIKGNVYGEIYSRQGRVDISGNVIQGTVTNRDGPIDIGGFISGSYIESIAGGVHVRRAENSKIRAKKVTLSEARNCTVLAEEVEIGFMQNTVVTGKHIHVRTAAQGSGISEREENLVIVEVPDVDSLLGMIAQQQALLVEVGRLLKKNLGQLQDDMARKKTLNEVARVARYFAGLRQIQKLKQSGQKINASTLNVFMLEKQKISDELLELMSLENDIKQLRDAVRTDKKKLEEGMALKSRHEQKLRDLSCRINLDILNVTGLTVVRKRIVGSDIPCLLDMTNSVQLRRELGFLGDEQDRLFNAAKGKLHWEFTPVCPL